jgi:hypothetical protein
MRKRTFSRQSFGSAMVVAMILLLVGTLAVAAYLTLTKTRITFGGFRQKTNQVRYMAETGFELGKADLRERASNQDFSRALRIGDQSSGSVTTAEAIDQGLIPDPTNERDCAASTRVKCASRISTRSTPFLTEVYYFPDSERNTNDDTRFPKFFTIVSVARNLVTDEAHTVEALVKIEPENFSKISWGMLNPTLRPGISWFPVNPATYDGPVYFGAFPTNKDPNTNQETKLWIDFVGGGGNDTHIFNDVATFGDKPLLDGRPLRARCRSPIPKRICS